MAPTLMCRKGGMLADATSSISSPLLFGGVHGKDGFDKHLWELVPTRGWQEIKTAHGPQARLKGVMCRVDDTTVVLHGGSSDKEYLGDLWVYQHDEKDLSLGHWREFQYKSRDRPTSRRAHTGVVAGGKRLIIFAGKGSDHKPLDDLWSLDLDTMKWEQETHVKFPLTPRKGHSATMVGDEMLVYGGRLNNHEYYDDLVALSLDPHSLKPVKWRVIKTAQSPGKRNHHVAIGLPGRRMLVYGGRSAHHKHAEVFEEIWVFEMAREQWHKMKALPDPQLPQSLATPLPRIEAGIASLTPSCSSSSLQTSCAVVISLGRDQKGDDLNDAWMLTFSSLEEKHSHAGAKWRLLAPLDCKHHHNDLENRLNLLPKHLTRAASYLAFTSVACFFGLGLFLVLSMYYRSHVRRASYQPLRS